MTLKDMTATPASQAAASENRNGRHSVGSNGPGFTNVSGGPSKGATRITRPGAPDPLGTTAGKGVRSKRGTLGAAYKITASMPAQAREAANTTANGRLLQPTGGASGNFYAQQLDGAS